MTPLLNAAQVAAMLGVSRQWVLEHSRENGPQPRVPCVALGRIKRYRPADIAEFIEECARVWNARKGA